jgi:hypothetical protein
MKSTGYKFTVPIAVHNTVTEWIRPSLVTSSSSSSVTACNGCVGSTTAASNTKLSTWWGAPRVVGRAVDSTSSRTPQFLYAAPNHTKNITVLPQQQQHIRNHIQQITVETKWSSRPSLEKKDQQTISGGEGQAKARSRPGGEGQATAKPGEVDQLEASHHQ